MFHTTFSLKAASDKEQEYTLKEANKQQSTRHLTCSMDDPDIALEKQELDGEKMPVDQQSWKLRVMTTETILKTR